MTKTTHASRSWTGEPFTLRTCLLFDNQHFSVDSTSDADGLTSCLLLNAYEKCKNIDLEKCIITDIEVESCETSIEKENTFESIDPHLFFIKLYDNDEKPIAYDIVNESGHPIGPMCSSKTYCTRGVSKDLAEKVAIFGNYVTPDALRNLHAASLPEQLARATTDNRAMPETERGASSTNGYVYRTMEENIEASRRIFHNLISVKGCLSVRSNEECKSEKCARKLLLRVVLKFNIIAQSKS